MGSTMSMADFFEYWARVWGRALADTVGLLGWDGIGVAQAIVYVVTLATTAFVYLRWEGFEALKEGYVKPFIYGVVGLLISAALVFLFFMLRAPYALDADARDRARAATDADSTFYSQRKPRKGDIPLKVAPDLTAGIPEAVNSAVRIQTLERELRDAQQEVLDLRRRLDDRAQRQNLRNVLTDFALAGSSLGARCRVLAPADYQKEASDWIASVAMAMKRSGMRDEARIFSSGQPPAGMPRLVLPTCEPYQDYSRLALSLGVRVLYINQVQERLAR